MNQAYAVLRLKQDYNRLKTFYLKKAAKSKVAAKIASALEDLDLHSPEMQESV